MDTNTLTIYHTLTTNNPQPLTMASFEMIAFRVDLHNLQPIIQFSQVNERIALHINPPIQWSKSQIFQYVDEVYQYLHDLY